MTGLLPPISRIHVSYGMILLGAILFYFDEGGLMLYTLAAISVHEAGHLLVIAVLGGHIEAVTINAFGVDMRLSPDRMFTPMQEIAVRLGGPAAGLVTAAVCSLAGHSTGDIGFFSLAGANFILAVINALPVQQTDGGLILYYALCLAKEPNFAQKTLNAITFIIGGVFFLSGMYVFYTMHTNITPMLFGLFALLYTDVPSMRKIYAMKTSGR